MENIVDKIKRCYIEKKNRKVSYVFERNKDIYGYCLKILNQNDWFETAENVFIAIAHNIFDVVLCKNCNQPIKVKKAIYGRTNYCCAQCTYHNEAVRNKQKQSCLKKYGTVTPLLNDECKEKTKLTCREKFNNDSFAGSEQYKRRIKSPFSKEEVRQKIKETKKRRYGEDYNKVIFEMRRQKIQRLNVERYGVPYLLNNKQICDKTHNTMLQRYGVDNFFASKQLQCKKFLKTWQRIKLWNKFVIPLFAFEDYKGKDIEYKWKCNICGGQFFSRIYTTGIGIDRSIPRCQKCYPLKNQSFAQRQLFDFIESIYGGLILKNDKTLIAPYQIDIYIPELKLGIQFDGLFYHNTKHKKKGYHLMKTNLCREKGIRIIHVFEYDWMNNRQVVKEKIKSAFGVFEKTVQFDECLVKEVEQEHCNQFLLENHLYEVKKSEKRIGLFYNQQLVFVMTFIKKKCCYELNNMCTKKGYFVKGIENLSRYFSMIHNKIITYVDIRYEDETLIQKIGFKKVGQTRPNFCYYKNNYRVSRNQQKEFLRQKYDEKLTKEQNMIFSGFNIVYDCGCFVYVFEKSFC